ncbi:tryptophan 7-halogenase [Actinomadura sp. 9N215]|uniref:tryptophan 7-halogenase n=1 Tax=Actinomadura sp. 9N215 TaxID=3375150 RepID=UPI00379DFB4B
MTVPEHDVVIIGAGPAGCATAIALRRHGAGRVLIVDAGDPEAPRAERPRDELPRAERPRAGESIPPDTRPLLEDLGVWDDFLAQGHEPCLGSCSSWGGEALGYNDYLFNPHGTGWQLERGRFDRLLARHAAAAADTLTRGRLVGVPRTVPGGIELCVARDDRPARTIRAAVAVDASGRRCRLARAMGARPRHHDRLTFVTGVIRLPASSEFPNLTLVEATEHGWWYAARLPGGRLAVAVATDPGIVRRLRLHTAEGWLAGARATARLSGELAGRAPTGGRVTARAAPSFVLDRASGPGWLAVGDAAASCDPICARGLHNALADGRDAALLIADRLHGRPRDTGDHHRAVDLRFTDYLRVRDHLYGLERRWPTAPFWHRRHRTTPSGRLQ